MLKLIPWESFTNSLPNLDDCNIFALKSHRHMASQILQLSVKF